MIRQVRYLNNNPDLHERFSALHVTVVNEHLTPRVLLRIEKSRPGERWEIVDEPSVMLDQMQLEHLLSLVGGKPVETFKRWEEIA